MEAVEPKIIAEKGRFHEKPGNLHQSGEAWKTDKYRKNQFFLKKSACDEYLQRFFYVKLFSKEVAYSVVNYKFTLQKGFRNEIFNKLCTASQKQRV